VLKVPLPTMHTTAKNAHNLNLFLEDECSEVLYLPHEVKTSTYNYSYDASI
jgi:hypothetical protein